ncbi:MAG: AMP-binding protein [Paludibacteraceae bacterium]|nr:AMP-binding protein [Paludibacteraceae bacterium]
MVNYLDILAETIRNNWDQPALTDFYLTEDGKAQDTSRGNRYTYGEMYAEIVRVADFLTQLGLQAGDHIAICGANSAHWVISYLAIAKMQDVSVAIMHTLQPDQIAQMINFSDAKALFIDKELWEELKQQSLPRVASVIALEDWIVLYGHRIRINDNNQLTINNDQCQFIHGELDELAMLCFTSGSSGKPKGVMLSYRNIHSSVRCVGDTYPVNKNRNTLALISLSHLLGFGSTLVQLTKCCHIFILRQSNDFVRLPQIIWIVQPYVLFGVPQLLAIAAKMWNQKKMLFLESFVVGGAVVSDVLCRQLKEVAFPLATGYGATESSGTISLASALSFREESSGKVVEGCSVSIAPNGEILVKGENVMLGYYKDPEATAQKIDKDGWLHTGDKGHLDEDGYLYVEGRLEQDIIVLPNGENIRPDAIESLINALPEVSDSIVFARDGHLIAIVVPPITNHQSPMRIYAAAYCVR